MFRALALAVFFTVLLDAPSYAATCDAVCVDGARCSCPNYCVMETECGAVDCLDGQCATFGWEARCRSLCIPRTTITASCDGGNPCPYSLEKCATDKESLELQANEEWAVIYHVADKNGRVNGRNVKLLASSSAQHGMQTLKNEIEFYGTNRARNTPGESGFTFSPKHNRTTVRIGTSINDKNIPFKCDDGTVFVRAMTNIHNSVDSIDVLYSSSKVKKNDLLEYLAQNVKVWSLSNKENPIVFYMVIGIRGGRVVERGISSAYECIFSIIEL